MGVWSGSLSGLLAIVAVSFGETPVTLTAAMSVFAFALGPLFATAPVLAFERVTDHGRGMSAALLSTFEMGGGALGALFVSLTPDGTAWPLAICVSGAAALLVGGRASGAAARNGRMRRNCRLADQGASQSQSTTASPISSRHHHHRGHGRGVERGACDEPGIDQDDTGRGQIDHRAPTSCVDVPDRQKMATAGRMMTARTMLDQFHATNEQDKAFAA